MPGTFLKLVRHGGRRTGAAGASLALVLLGCSSGAQATVVDTGGTQCCSSIVPEFPPATYYGATMVRSEEPLASAFADFSLPADPPASVDALLEDIDRIEIEGGAMAPALVEPLQGLSAAYLARGRTREAIAALRRGIHVARLNFGLHAQEQVALLEQLIAILLRERDFVEADAQQTYLYRVLSWRKGHDSPDVRDATLRYADWMRGAYLGDLDRERYPRLVGLNDLYANAMEEIEAAEGPDSRRLLPFLDGRIELAYLISVYPGENEAGFRSGGPMSNFEVADGDMLRFWRMRDHNFRYGRQALEQKVAILEESPESKPEDIAAARLALADWHQWHRRYAEAIRHYEQCWELMQSTEGGDAWLARELGAPLELPRSRVFAPGPVPLGTLNEAQVSVAFSVSRHGEARDIEILTEKSSEHMKSAVTRAYHYLRNVRFRPRVADGEVVLASDIQRTYDIRY